MDKWVNFARARLDEREKWAKDAAAKGGPHWPTGDNDRMTPDLIHARANDPAYVLVDIAAKRKILDEYERLLAVQKSYERTPHVLYAFERVIDFLNEPFRQHPEYPGERP